MAKKQKLGIRHWSCFLEPTDSPWSGTEISNIWQTNLSWSKNLGWLQCDILSNRVLNWRRVNHLWQATSVTWTINSNNSAVAFSIYSLPDHTTIMRRVLLKALGMLLGLAIISSCLFIGQDQQASSEQVEQDAFESDTHNSDVSNRGYTGLVSHCSLEKPLEAGKPWSKPGHQMMMAVAVISSPNQLSRRQVWNWYET